MIGDLHSIYIVKVTGPGSDNLGGMYAVGDPSGLDTIEVDANAWVRLTWRSPLLPCVLPPWRVQIITERTL